MRRRRQHESQFAFTGSRRISHRRSSLRGTTIFLIVVYHRARIQGETVQRVDVYYKMIGHVELPHITRKESEAYLEAFGRKSGQSA